MRWWLEFESEPELRAALDVLGGKAQVERPGVTLVNGMGQMILWTAAPGPDGNVAVTVWPRVPEREGAQRLIPGGEARLT